MSLHPGNIVVTGTPGANLKLAAELLTAGGYQILWPGQDLSFKADKEFFDKNGCNPILHNMLRCLFTQREDLNYPMSFCDFYPDLKPSVEDYVARFSATSPIAFVGLLVGPYMDLFKEVAKQAVVVEASREDDVEALRRLCGLTVPSELDDKLLDRVLARLRSQLSGFSKSSLWLDKQMVDQLRRLYA